MIYGAAFELKTALDETRRSLGFNAENTNTKVKSSDKILEYLKKEGSISSSIAMSITGLSSAGVRKILSKFTETGIIKPEGANRNRIYIFAGKEKNNQTMPLSIFK